MQFFSSEIAGLDLGRLRGDSDSEHPKYEVELVAAIVAFEA